MKWLPYLILLIAFTPVHAQNLVPNPSFEQFTVCPNNLAQFTGYCSSWYDMGNTPEYYNSCSVNPSLRTPSNFAGYQPALNGTAYCGIITQGGTEYVANAIPTLQKGSRYIVSISVSLANNSALADNGLGVSFFKTGHSAPNTPQISYASYGVITDTQNWVRLSSMFTADTNYDHIVIGRFSTAPLTFTSVRVSPGINPSPLAGLAYYLLDSVEMLQDLHCTFKDTALCAGDSILVPYTTIKGYNAGNIVTAQLSDANGSFNNPINIGAGAGTVSGSVKCQVPYNIAGGYAYQIRVLTNNPGDLSEGNGINIHIKPQPQKPIAASNSPVCINDTLNLVGSIGPAGTTYKWSKAGGGFTCSSKDTILTPMSIADEGNYVLTITYQNCTNKDTETISTKPTPPAPYAGPDFNACPGTTLYLTAITNAVNPTWSWKGPGNFNSNFQSTSRNNMQTSWAGNYIVSNTVNGCTSRDTVNVTAIITTPTPTASSNSPVCMGGNLNLSASQVPGALYFWNGPGNFVVTKQSTTRTNMSMNDAGNYYLTISLGDCVSLPSILNVNVVKGPSVIIYPNPNDSICDGATASLAAVPNNTSPQIQFQWYLNSTMINGATKATYTSSTIKNSDTFTVMMVDPMSPCNTPILSNKMVMTVLPNVPGPHCSITVDPDTNVWAGLQLKFTANVTDCNGDISYQWCVDGKPVKDANTNPWLTTRLSDGVNVTCVARCGVWCPVPDSALSNSIHMHVSTGIEAVNNLQPAISVYPNPNDGKFTIKGTALSSPGADRIDVINSLGQIVYTKSAIPVNGILNEDIDLASQPAGVYMLRMGNTHVQIVKSK